MNERRAGTGVKAPGERKTPLRKARGAHAPPASDVLAALRGLPNFLTDLYDAPGVVAEAAGRIHPVADGKPLRRDTVCQALS